MSGDWIKVQHVTPDKPEVFRIASHLNLDPDTVVGKLLRVWIWADQQSHKDDAPGVTVALIDHVARVTGFGDAMQSVGWLVEDGDGLRFTNIQRHIAESAKRRALTRNRNEIYRRKSDGGVTQASSQESHDSVNREEKRREDNTHTPAKRFVPPTVGEVAAYADHLGKRIDAQRFVDFYESKGWVVGKSKMKSWQAAVRNWISRNDPPPTSPPGSGKRSTRDVPLEEFLNDRSWAE